MAIKKNYIQSRTTSKNVSKGLARNQQYWIFLCANSLLPLYFKVDGDFWMFFWHNSMSYVRHVEIKERVINGALRKLNIWCMVKIKDLLWLLEVAAAENGNVMYRTHELTVINGHYAIIWIIFGSYLWVILVLMHDMGRYETVHRLLQYINLMSFGIKAIRYLFADKYALRTWKSPDLRSIILKTFLNLQQLSINVLILLSSTC
jgi:hypothetical protein